MGYGAAPKVALIALVCFFPLTIGVLDAFKSIDDDTLNLFRAMGASKLQILIHAKIPCAAPAFFSGLKIAASYAVVGGVISEWLGGNAGLGVYMTRARHSYAFDKMFAVIFFISALSLVLIWSVTWLARKATPWK
ncbi:MAG: ABC transporter permease subunit, partial [Clostridiales bacterium]|jgi:ABC-type nitrate/sulfonate/bicarbonate transport system permease component|nr:ABC transporter permease subunit [Clostridiales bacterium]